MVEIREACNAAARARHALNVTGTNWVGYKRKCGPQPMINWP